MCFSFNFSGCQILKDHIFGKMAELLFTKAFSEPYSDDEYPSAPIGFNTKTLCGLWDFLQKYEVSSQDSLDKSPSRPISQFSLCLY